MDSINTLFLLSGFLIALSILASRLSTLVGVPLLLIFLGLGMLAGEEGLLGIQFDDYPLAFLIGHLALAMILLDGGLRTRLKTFRVGFKPALSLATLGVFRWLVTRIRANHGLADNPAMTALVDIFNFLNGRWCQPQRDFARFNSSQFKKLSHQLRQRVHLLFCPIQKTLRGWWIIQNGHPQSLNKRLQRGDWGSQLMGNVANEVPPDRFQTVNPG